MGASLLAQTPDDSLTREDVIRLTLSNQPQVSEAEQRLAAADARIEVNRASLYPEVAISGGYTRIAPVSTITLGSQSFRSYPNDNYDAHVELRQTLYDFGKNRTSIDVATAARQSASDYIDQVRRDLAYQAIAAFYSILILQNTVAVIDSEIAALQQHAAVSTKRIQAGTATNYDTLTTAVRIALANNERTDAVSAMSSQMILLHELTGLPDERPINLKGSFAAVSALPRLDSLLTAAEENRPELILARDAERVAEMQLRLAGLGDRPSVSFTASSGVRNGYVPTLSEPKANYTAGVLLRMPLFNGHRTRYEVVTAQANLLAAREHTADVRRQMAVEVRQALVSVQSSLTKISSADVQVRQAEQAVAMANTRYEAGVITNLELLDAQTTLLQSRLIRLRAFYDYTVGLARLDRATGREIW